ncbi:hypothetical protein LOAG_18772 [Loa loa]|uniref:RRM domain-containing protein n=1 Tax=Loa loa TaxID=7209 RepID=A0A1S0UDU6_LOALO|nr:hypothetical protein LOAG_18772 [Loa loa]EJD73832.1 hypothetical protein LOAG_18772 [Loa loa]
MSRRSDPLDCKVYVGGLPQDATSQELEDAFNRFGRIRKVWVARRPPGFAFVEFEDARDAEDAVKALDGTRICGVRARVEISHGRRRNGGYGGGGGGGGGGYYEGSRRRSRYLEAKRVSYFTPSVRLPLLLLPHPLLLLLLLLLPLLPVMVALPLSQLISTSTPVSSALQQLLSILLLPNEHLHKSITTFPSLHRSSSPT